MRLCLPCSLVEEPGLSGESGQVHEANRPIVHFIFAMIDNNSMIIIDYTYHQDPMIKEDDLMMISESDVFITTDLVLKPLDNLSFKAWVYWVSDNNGRS